VVWPQNEDDASFFEPLVAAYEGAPLTGTYQGRTWREGARVRLDWRLNRVWLVFEPSTFVDPAPRTSDSEVIRRSRFSEQDGAADWVRERWAVRRNKVWAGAVGAWAALLAPEDTSTFSAPFIDNSRLVTARFTIGAQTAFSRPGHRTTRGAG
jgi:hypothetical protein